MISKYNARTQLYFRDLNGNPFVMTPTQEDIFRIVYEKNIRRGAIRTITQYGKSEIASMAIVMAAVERVEKIIIVSPSIKQSSIIMGKVIQHFFDNPVLVGMIEYYGKLEQLKSERSKTKITTRNGSEIMILTAEAGSVAREAKSLMGFGATMVVVDESALIDDTLYSKILRMVGGVKGGKLVQLGNPFEKNHFYNAFNSSRYEKVIVNWQIALEEGRVTQEFLDEARENIPPLDWLIFYECQFPDAGPQDALIPIDWIENAINQSNCLGEHRQAGLDVARFGNDKTVYVFRRGGEVQAIKETSKMDNMEVVGWVRGLIDGDQPEVTAIDSIGVGAGVTDRLAELDYEVSGVSVADAPTSIENKERFKNLRAEIFWHLRDMFKPDKNGQSQISIPNDPELKKQLEQIIYKYSSEKKIQMEGKDEMKKRLGSSPDKADALALAFYDLQSTEPSLFIG